MVQHKTTSHEVYTMTAHKSQSYHNALHTGTVTKHKAQTRAKTSEHPDPSQIVQMAVL